MIDPWARLIPGAVSVVEEISRFNAKPWLIVGKGPSTNQLPLWDLSAFHIITLNHACRLCPNAALHHFVDWEAYLACRMPLKPQWGVVMPWHPHVNFRAELLTLGTRISQLKPPALHKFCSYNAGNTKHDIRADLPRLALRYFSATAAFSLLTKAKQSPVYSIGIDGGLGYAEGFSALDRLANGQVSFDCQMPYIKQIMARARVPWHRLDGDVTGEHRRFSRQIHDRPITHGTA